MIQINDFNVSQIYFADTLISAIYVGDILVWSASGGQPPPTPTGLQVILEDINGQPPTPTGLTVVLENING